MSIAKQETWLATLLVLAFSSAWLVLVQADDDTTTMKLSEVVELLQPLGQSCDPIPEKEEVEEMVLNKEDPSYESKCFRRCLLEQFDVMPKGKQQYDANKTVDMMNMMFPEMEEQSTIITSKCNQAAGITDECEIAHSIAMCMLGEMRASNYKIPKVEE